MRFETIDILSRPMRTYVPDGTERAYYRGKRPAVVIFPGGGYQFTYEGEAEPIALRFAAEGICAFVLDYTTTDVASEVFPHAIREAFAAVRYVRTHAEEYGIDPQNIATCGFSAGGHLCACTGTLWNKPEAAQFFDTETETELSRPDKLLLCYPVIRGKAPGHIVSFYNLFGKENVTDELLEAYSLQNRVDERTPQSFLWATSEDDAVPAQSSLEFAHALATHGVKYELHIWRDGGHGLCLGDHVTQAFPKKDTLPVAEWTRLAINFMYKD